MERPNYIDILKIDPQYLEASHAFDVSTPETQVATYTAKAQRFAELMENGRTDTK